MKQQVYVFKTNISSQYEANRITKMLMAIYTKAKIIFDLEDCDNILRVEDFTANPKRIVKLVEENGFLCEELD